jgi:outer membrane receptor protein involved in Fe transport
MFRRFNRYLLFLIPSALLLAQPETSTLRGTITDTAGAAVEGVQLVLFETGKELSVREVSTGAGGHYEAPFLRPGSYVVKIDANHYQTFEADSILLTAGQVRNFDAQLKPEARDETVLIDESPVRVQSQNGAVAGIVNFRLAWQDAPFVDLHPSVLPLLTQAPATQGNQAGLVISGVSARNQQTWSLDGVAQDTTTQTGNPAFFETVEVAIANSGVDSAKPVHVNMISKHGSDGLHGLVYYKRASSAFNSKSYFDTQKSSYKLSEVQGELGGALIPRWTYFYAGAMYQKTPFNETLYADVPTTQMRTLDFSQFLNPLVAPNGKVVVIRDPRNGAPFPNNIIPTNRLNAVASSYLTQYYPAYNAGTANTFTQNYTWNHPYGSDSYVGNWPFGRIDQRLSASTQVYFRWMQNQTASIAPGSVGEQLNATQTVRYRGWVVSGVSAITSSLTNQISAGSTTVNVKQGESESKFSPLQGNSVVSGLGIQGVNPNAYSVMGFPAVSISGLTGLSMAYDGGHNSNTAANDSIKTIQDSLTWSHGRHSLKFGGQYQGYHWLEGAVPQNVFGAFTFTGAFTGLGFADFALGLPSTSTRQAGRVDRTLHQDQSGLFLSDSIRATSRLTLDFGVRWDYYTTPVYDDGYMSNWDPVTGKVTVAPGTLTAVSSFFPKGATVVLGDVVPKAKTTNFRPRVAAAYRLAGNLVLRGGYGEFTENEGYGVAGRLSVNNPYSLTETYTNSITNGVAALTFPKPFPASPSSSLLPGQNITALPAKTVEGVIRQYNATLETVLHGFGLRASYIGSRGVNMNYALDVNKPAASTTAFATSRKPFPIWASAYEVRTDGQWRYDSAVASAQRTTGPVTFTSSFTWGNNTSNYADTTDPYNVTNKWTRDASDRQRYFTAGAFLPLPVGKGHSLLGQTGAIVNRVISDWKLQAITTFASGQYFSPLFTGPDPANATQGFVTQLPDCVGDPNAGARTISKWFNPSAFAIPSTSAGRYGTCGMNTLEGYPIHIAHVSAVKTFSFTEQVKAVFTAQISNVTNTPHFTIPNNNLSNPNPGAFTFASLAPNSTPERLGNRQIDFKLRLIW